MRLSRRRFYQYISIYLERANILKYYQSVLRPHLFTVAYIFSCDIYLLSHSYIILVHEILNDAILFSSFKENQFGISLLCVMYLLCLPACIV